MQLSGRVVVFCKTVKSKRLKLCNTALARQAMEAFRRSQRPDGLINADAPTVKSNAIPAFSIYYLLMIHDHMMYFGDKALVKRHLPAIDGIL